jgi:hypothetical protein
VCDIGRVRRLVEKMRIGIERDTRARVAEDAADLGNVELQVDDQVAGERVPQVVDAERRLALQVQAGVLRGAPEATSLDVAIAERHA